MTNRNYSAKRYFIFAFKRYVRNDYRIMAKKYVPSIREILCDYIDIYEDINENKDQDKLERSRNDLLCASKFFIKNSVLYKSSPYKKDLETLITQIEEVNKPELGKKDRLVQYTRIYNSCESLRKKISKDNIYFLIISLVKDFKTFAEVDKAVEAVINELLYDGYSLKYLDTWFNKNINIREITENNIDGKLDQFLNLVKSPEIFKYYISIVKCNQVDEGELVIDFNLKLIKKDFDALVLIDAETATDVKNYLQNSEDYNIFEVEIRAIDIYKGLEVLVNAVDTYFQMIKYVSDEERNIMLDKVVVEYKNNKFEKLRIESYDEKILFSNIENRERVDIENFITYRDRIYKSGITYDEITNLQRALNIVKNQQSQSPENRVINLWAVLEYILTFHEGVNIISKVKEIVPKLVCLYLIKDKLNVFWFRLNSYKDSGVSIANEILNDCKKVDEERFYDVDKLTGLIQEKGSKLIEEFGFNDLLKRDIAEIGDFLNNPESREKYITQKHDEVYHDIIRIYRTRNMLIHSGKRIKMNLNYEALRLYQYNNSLLGLIIYYKNKNPLSTITEILNSVIYTYNEYMKILKNKDTSPKEICKPGYLFIG